MIAKKKGQNPQTHHSIKTRRSCSGIILKIRVLSRIITSLGYQRCVTPKSEHHSIIFPFLFFIFVVLFFYYYWTGLRPLKIGQTNPRGGGEDDHDGGGNLSFLTVIHEPKFRFRPTLTRNFARLPPISRLKAFLVSLENVPDKNVMCFCKIFL